MGYKYDELTEFERKVLNATKKIPKGKVTTYSIIAKAIEKPKAIRAVGNALNKNPYTPIIPCHRVVKSDGSIGDYAKGVRKKVKMLRDEGVREKKGRIVNFKKVLFEF
jgi:methylated-DNA-[protein]-cysteine S-methyltransferase